MVDKTLEYVDFTKLLEVLTQYSSTAFILERVSGLRPLTTLDEIEIRQEKTQAVLDVVETYGPVPLSDIPDVRAVIDRLALRDLSLDPADLLAVGSFLSAVRDATAFLKKIPKKSDFITLIVDGLSPLPHLASLIRKTVNEDGTIEDSASYELSKIRADIYQQKERARRTLDRMMEMDDVQPVLQDRYVAIRNGRYVLPLKPNYNQYFRGIVHDYSHSLKTSFVEPVQIMELNNSISVLGNEEKEEELRVLRHLTDSLREHIMELESDLTLVSDLDFYHTLARFALAFGCVRPKVETNGPIEIRSAVNPFITISKKDGAVPIDILIGEDKKAVIISGPNGDGKTVALKTTGLLLTMAFSGLFVPARGTPRLRFFPGVYAVLGDQQDISMELSTFTAHIGAITSVYEACQGGELVLVDEIGGGTEPQEASALSMAILDAFAEKMCTIVVTTHLNLLKAYGSTRPFALNIATDFDLQGMKPLYRLLYGIAGVSNALKVAERSGLPQAIVEKSYGYLGKQEYVLNDLIQGLEKEKREAGDERQKARVYREEIKRRLETLKETRNEYLAKVERECARRVVELETEVELIRKDIARKDRESLRAAKEKVSRMQRRLVVEGVASPPAKVAAGDYVRVRTIGKEGYVSAVDESKRMVEVVVGNMRMRINKDYVEKASKGKGERTEDLSVSVTEIEVPEINVRGMRVDDALEEVDRFVDRAVVHGSSQLKIVHGIGTGRLMTAIRLHLSEARNVKGIRKDEKNSGVTIVELL